MRWAMRVHGTTKGYDCWVEAGHYGNGRIRVLSHTDYPASRTAFIDIAEAKRLRRSLSRAIREAEQHVSADPPAPETPEEDR